MAVFTMRYGQPVALIIARDLRPFDVIVGVGVVTDVECVFSIGGSMAKVLVDYLVPRGPGKQDRYHVAYDPADLIGITSDPDDRDTWR